MRATVLHNPTAGPGDVSADEMLDVVGRARFTPRYANAKDPQFPVALQDAADVVVVAGGDGTVGRVVRHLADRTIPFAILPLGGANNIATSLGISGCWRTLPGQWAFAPRRPLNVGVAYGPWGRRLFIEAIGVGALPLAAIRASCRQQVNIEVCLWLRQRLRLGKSLGHERFLPARMLRVLGFLNA